MSAELQAIGANADPPSTRSTPRCSNASTRPASWCGRASARSKARATGTRTPRARRRRARRPRHGDRRAAASVDLRLEPRRRGGGQRPRQRGGAVRQSMARWLHAHDRAAWWRVDMWGRHPRSTPGAHLPRTSTRSAETEYSGWYEQPPRPRPAWAQTFSAASARDARTFAGKVLVISEFGAESNTLNPPEPRQLRLPVAPARAATSDLRRDPTSPRCSSGCCATSRSPPHSSGGSITR